MTTASAKLISLQTKRTLREPAAVFFMLALAPLFAIMMGLIFGNEPSPVFGGRGYLDANLASFAAIIIAISSFVIVPIDLVTQRENGSLRRFRATPLSPLIYIASDVLVRFTISLISVAGMIVIGIFVFDASPEGNLTGVLLVAALGILTFLAIGYALAALIPSQGVAQAIGNALVYPLIFLSGAAVPTAVLPDGVGEVARLSPLTQLVELLRGLWAGESWSENWVSLVVLLGVLALATAVAARFFRWE